MITSSMIAVLNCLTFQYYERNNKKFVKNTSFISDNLVGPTKILEFISQKSMNKPIDRIVDKYDFDINCEVLSNRHYLCIKITTDL